MWVNETYLVPSEAFPDWQQRIRISRTAGESAFANDMVGRIKQRCGGQSPSAFAQDFPRPQNFTILLIAY